MENSWTGVTIALYLLLIVLPDGSVCAEPVMIMVILIF